MKEHGKEYCIKCGIERKAPHWPCCKKCGGMWTKFHVCECCGEIKPFTYERHNLFYGRTCRECDEALHQVDIDSELKNYARKIIKLKKL